MSSYNLKKLEEYPDLLTPCEVAEVLRCRESMVHRLNGLRKTRIGNGRGRILYRRQDIMEYINSKVEGEEVIKNADQQKERHRKMGVPSLISREEVQKELDSRGTIDGLRFIKDLRDRYRIIPGEADYNIADILFKDGKAAMIINGDWSWAGYQKAGIRIGVDPLPRIEETGLWCAPMVSPKGFSMNVNVRPEKRPLVIRLLKFLMRPDVQLQTARSLLTMPTRREALADDFVRNDPIMKNSAQQIRQGRTMPVIPELRAIWDAMRPSYQAVLGGAKSPEQAAREMQDLAVRKIKEMNE